jgi:predicted RNA-binding Zn-ribbon protein involved in translation (DUF1610 family)
MKRRGVPGIDGPAAGVQGGGERRVMHTRNEPGLVSLSFRRALAARDLILALVALLLLVVAVVIFLRYKPEDAAPTDKFVSFYCPKCDYFFRRTEREFDESFEKKREFRHVEGRGVLFKCVKCGELTAERRDEPPPKGNPPGAGADRPGE